MAKILIPLASVLLLLVACHSKEKKNKYNQVYYRAINNKDTATLVINRSDKRFYGRYEITYYQFGKDSGDVRGDIKDNTLRGDYHYISNGGSWKRVPLALLEKENKLFLGNGVVGTFMNLPCFLPGTIDFNNSKFIFEEVKK